ncbi:hypothetical protein J4457_01795 [Candidatus Woesearchaeota archaeon]|nr:hypothetical protein [Candidatus Woesearchaeota archaeon]
MGGRSFLKSSLPKSLRLSYEGKMLNIFLTGISSKKNDLNKGRWGKDLTYVNETRIMKKNEVIEEARVNNAVGAIITGADPLMKIDRCVSYIGMLKEAFGKDFYIQLLIPPTLVTPQRLERVFLAGLDEISFRMSVHERSDWSKVRYAQKYAATSIVFDAFPNKKNEAKALIDAMKGRVKHIIIRELEKNDSNEHLCKDLKVKKNNSIQDSEETAHELVKYALKKKYHAHYSSSKMKHTTTKERMKLRAKQVARKYEKVTNEGTIVHGVIYLPEIIPSAEYHLKLQSMNKKTVVKKLFRIKRDLQRELRIQFDAVDVDPEKLRLITDTKTVQHHARHLKSMKLKPAIVEEYPAAEVPELQVEYL